MAKGVCRLYWLELLQSGAGMAWRLVGRYAIKEITLAGDRLAIASAVERDLSLQITIDKLLVWEEDFLNLTVGLSQQLVLRLPHFLLPRSRQERNHPQLQRQPYGDSQDPAPAIRFFDEADPGSLLQSIRQLIGIVRDVPHNKIAA